MDSFIVFTMIIMIFLLWKNSQLLNVALQQEQSNSDGQVYVYNDDYPYYRSWRERYPYWSWWGGGYPYRWRRHDRRFGGRGFRRGYRRRRR